jgi:CheY-like chemotaxis protein
VLAVQQPVIIALTANALEGDREKCLEAGMNDFIAKPINKRDIAQALKNWLDDSQIKTMGNNAI